MAEALSLSLKGPILNFILRIDGRRVALRFMKEGTWERKFEGYPLATSMTINLYAEGIDHQPWSLTVRVGKRRPLTLRGRFKDGKAERLEELGLRP